MYYTLEKTAEVLEMSTGEVNKLREQGKLRAYRDGSTWKFDEAVVKKFLTDMIKSRNKDDSDLLSSEDDEDGPTMLADSSAFDSMLDNITIDDAGLSLAKEDDDLSLSKEDDGLTLAKEDNDLSLSKEDDGLSLAKEDDDLTLSDDDDDLKLADETSTPLTDEHSALADDGDASASPSSVDLGGTSDDDMLHLDGDSGLQLIDDVDDAKLGGSSVSLGDEDDVVLGGGSSGSGSGLDLSGDSGLSLMEDEDDFQLSDSASSTPADDDLSLAKEEDDDDGIFELADDNSKDVVLNLEEGADSEAATELAIADDSIFDLADDTAAATTETSTSESDSASASQMIDVENDPFTTDDGADDSPSDSTPATSDPFTTDTGFSTPVSEDPFAVADDSNDPFAGGGLDGLSLDPSPIGNGAAQTETPDFSQVSGNSFVESSVFNPGSDTDSIVPDPAVAPEGGFAPAPSSTQYTGKDMIILVPCLLLLILATIGAWELCRTIWSYQEGAFDFGGPVLEAIAKMVKLI